MLKYTFFISDLHFGHKNVLLYDNRPFLTVEEHDKKIIENWNKMVKSQDDVYILGDVSWWNLTKTVEILNSLNGKKHLIIGNHDRHFLNKESFKNCFEEICWYKEIEVDGFNVAMFHNPIFSFNDQCNGRVHLYGHVHSSFESNMFLHHQKAVKALYSKDGSLPGDVFRAYNVGCMMPYINYAPKTLTQIIIGKGVD